MELEIEVIRIGTRKSPLALWQANWIKSQLEELHPNLKVELVLITTTGDKIQDAPLAKIGGKGLFVKEIEEALIRKEIDLAVHSMKDVPIKLPQGLEIGVITEREDPHDALISKNNIKLADLPKGARVGTGSLRRSTQLKAYRPDLKIVPLRGNVDTRLKKLDTENLDAVILAKAGLIRLGKADIISETIGIDVLLPAMGQGAVGIETRTYDVEVMEALIHLDHEETHLQLDTERAFLKVLGGGCQVPIGAHAVLNEEEITFKALVSNLDGKTILRSQSTGSKWEAEKIGYNVGQDLLKQGADKILEEVYSSLDGEHP